MTHSFSVSSPIRPVETQRDLFAVADLIEVCFADTLDEDGHAYLRQLRWMARSFQPLPWLAGAADRAFAPFYGFVWEEQGHVVGNLSLIPLRRGRRTMYLIANVAVHPQYRQRGIARALTHTAITSLRERGEPNVWLQVRDDNPAALHLYQSLGFVERARRATWGSRGNRAIENMGLPAGFTVGSRRAQDWPMQSEWLHATYPLALSWNLPVRFDRFDPSMWNQLLHWLRGESQQHWAVYTGQQVCGFATWEPSPGSSDTLWLAVNPLREDDAVSALLGQVSTARGPAGRTLSINYPSGQAEVGFTRANWVRLHTLLWMERDLRGKGSTPARA